LNCFFTRIIIISVVLFSVFPLNSMGAEKNIPDEIAKDLALIEASVIKGPDGRYLLNIGENNQIKKGDLWTLYSAGEQIIDPGTGKKLGTLPTLLAICKVVRVEKKFSEITIKCLNEPCDIQSGLTAHRFRDIKTTFQDMDDASFHLYELIRARLPALDWQGYQRIDDTARTMPSSEEIVIIADKKILTIWSGGEIVAVYDKSIFVHSASQPETIQPELSVTKTKVNTSIQENIPGLSKVTPGLNTTLEIKNIFSVGDIEHAVTSMGIMTPIDSQIPYFIYLYDKTIDARAMDGSEKLLYTYKGFGEVIDMSLGNNGLIVLNIFVQSEGMRSRVLRFSSAGFTVLSKDIDYFMKFSDAGESNGNVSLIGQKYDTDNSFDPVAFHLDIDTNGDIKRLNTIGVPAGFRLPGAFFDDLNGNKIQEFVFYNAGGKLAIFEDNNQKWKSAALFGPSNSILVDDMINETNAPTDLHLWPQPVLLQSDNLILAVIPVNSSGFWRIAIENSQTAGLGILCPQNGSYTFRLFNTRFQGAVQSICLYGNTLYVAVGEGNSFTGKERTQIFAIPVQDIKTSLN
jgi:hypothetical protein